MFRKQDADFADRIDSLIDEFGRSNPQQRELAKLVKDAREADSQISRTLKDVQESLDYLRVCIKYVVFDIEATRRENKYLRRRLAEGEDQDVSG